MDVSAPDPIVETIAPVEESAPVADDSLAAHEQTFGDAPKAAVSASEDDPPKERHRARSQQASADDVAQINALTRQLREKETELERAKPGALSGSPRLRALQRQIKAIEAELTPPAASTPPARAPEPTRTAPAVVPGTPFSEPKPKIDDFANEEDPYEAKVLATARWERRKEQYEAHQAYLTRQADEARRTTMAERADIARTAQTRLKTFAEKTPHFETTTSAFMDRQIPSAMIAALISSDKYGELVYALAQQPDLADDFVLQATGIAPSDDYVATLQRRLIARLLAVKTGAAAASPTSTPAPRPPTPVRTGPMIAGPELPGDESSLAEHEKAFGQKRRR